MGITSTILEDWRPCFAWLPVRLQSGKIAWLKTIERRTLGIDGSPTLQLYRSVSAKP
jgi:hypothetical protein